jgi:translation initiation factor IF-2
MSETDNKPTLGRRPLGLKTSVQAGEVKQTFSHGRTNKVVVEVKRRKILGKPGEAPVAPPPPPPPPAPVAEAPQTARKPAPSAAAETPQERVARMQREAEEARLKQAEEANRREQEERARALEDEKRRADDNRKAEAGAPAPAPAPVAEPEVPSDDVEAPAGGEGGPAPRRFTPVAAPRRAEPAK